MSIKLVALDMDGTLLKDDHSVTAYTKEVIQKAIKKDVQIVLCTGRPLSYCYSYVEELCLNSYIIVANGAQIWNINKKLIDQHILVTHIIESIWDYGRINNFFMMVASTEKLYINNLESVKFNEHEWLKIVIENLTIKQIEETKRFLSQYDNLEITSSSPVNLEINKKGVHKASALQKVCNKLGITMNEVMAIGDSLNDFTMIKNAGIGVAMGNAQQEIKEIADCTTFSNNEDGVAKAIERFVL